MPTEKWRKENVDRVRASRRKWYDLNKEHAKTEVKRRQSEIRQWIFELTATLKFSRCPETHIAVIDFHHKDPTKKDIGLSKVAKWGWSKERILKEIEKCIVLCSNCHRKLHWEEKHKE
jgi:hypothetical protein